MVFYAGVVTLVALLAAFAILLAKKTGVVEWMQVNGGRIVSELFSCDFCLSFWTATAILVVLALFTWRLELLLFGMLTSPITRMLV